MRVTQGTFSFLPDFTDEQVQAQIVYALNHHWAISIEYTDDPHPRNAYWEMWGLPVFDTKVEDTENIMREVRAAREAFPEHYVKVIAYDPARGRQTTALAFIVNRPTVEKPFFLREATQRIKRVIDKIALEKLAKSSSSDGVVRGSLAQMNVIDLVQSLEMGRKSCLLTLTKDGEKCEMYFSEGQVPHATYGSLNGDAAVFKVLKWTGGNFQINFEGKTNQQSTTLNTQGLLMEGLRLLDEEKRDSGDQSEEEDDVLLDS